MRSIILLLVVQLLILSNITCIDDFLSKFHQNNYKIRDIRAELGSYDEEYFNIFEVRTFKYNRSIAAVNITFNFKVDVLDKLEILVQSNKFLSNEYRHFPVRFQVNFKRCFDANIMGIANAKKCGNIAAINFHKGITYRACNFVVDESHLPPLIPTGRYRIDMSILYLDKKIALLNGFAEVYVPTVYPKN